MMARRHSVLRSSGSPRNSWYYLGRLTLLLEEAGVIDHLLVYPLVRGQLLKLLNERAPLYSEVATEAVDTDEVAPAEVVELIMNAYVGLR